MNIEEQVREFAAAATAAFEDGSPEKATELLQEAVSILAECCNVDATELLEALAYGLR